MPIASWRSLLPMVAVVSILPGVSNATNGYQLIGIGAYQKSLAGAVTANPASAMTAVTNPAGLARIENRADFSMEAFMPSRSTDFSALGGSKETSSVEMYGIPSLGWKGQLGNSDRYFFGGGMYGTSGMGVDYPQTRMMFIPAGAFGAGNPPANSDALWDGYSAMAFWQMAPAFAWKASNSTSYGVSVNLDYQQVSFKQRVQLDVAQDGTIDATMDNFDLSRGASAFGFGLTFGMLHDINDRLTLGLNYKSKQDFSELQYNLAAGDLYIDGGAPGEAGRYSLDLDYPQQLALGLAWKATEAVTISADTKWIDWSSTMDKLAVKGPAGTQRTMDPGWSDQTVFAIGVAWAVNKNTNLRAGYNYTSSPIDSVSAYRNLILPAIVEEHFTVGADWKLDRHWDIGFHYMYVPEASVTAAASVNPMELPGTVVSMNQSSLGINLGYRF